MSLSYEPQIRITYTTAKEICDDIWAGTLQYARQAGFKVNPLVTMAIWSGFLLTAKNELEKHGILTDVQKEFIPSLARIYGIGMDEVELLADIKKRQQLFWEIISSEMGNLNSSLEIFFFIQMVDELNAQRVTESEGMPLTECAELFKKSSNLLSSHIYHILRKIDNDMLLQFENPRPNVTTPPSNPQRETAAKKDKKTARKSFNFFVFIALLVGFFVFFDMFAISDNSSASKTTHTPTTAQVQQLQALPKPSSGKILSGTSYGESEITVTASSGANHVVSLKTASGVLRVAFFVRSGDTITLKVPREKLYVYFASGDDWYGYGKGKMFGENTAYSMDDQILDFSNYTWEYTLKPVTNGNFSETPIDENDFF